MFFVATAPLAGDGPLNYSPKRLRQEFLVTGPRRDQTGSGVETIAHLKENGRSSHEESGGRRFLRIP